MSDVSPKSAVELAMEKLARQDAEAGIKAQALTAEQKQGIADARRNYEAKVAECRILHTSELVAVSDPNAHAELEANFRRELERFATDRDRKIDIIRGQSDKA